MTVPVTAASLTETWVFLGDSLTEGIGTRRVSYVSELAKLLRVEGGRAVHELRFRMLDLSSSRDLAHFNAAAQLVKDGRAAGSALWLVNLAAEGTLTPSDLDHVALVAALKCSRVFVLRGALESVLRPRQVKAGGWPFWTPRSWRHFAALDPRCFFSATWWRKARQAALDAAKQRLRLRLLAEGGAPLVPDDEFLRSFEALLRALAPIGARIIVLALPPISGAVFPGSDDVMQRRNASLCALCAARQVEFIDWHAEILRGFPALFCRDGFHPNESGARLMASILQKYLSAPAETAHV